MQCWRLSGSEKRNRDSIFRRMTLQTFQYECFQDIVSMFSELSLKMGAKDVKRIGGGGDGTWKHKGNLEDNYKMTEINLY